MAASVTHGRALRYARGSARGLLHQLLGHDLPLPFRQQDLADALGLSLVHTNKVLARLRETQLLTWRDGRLSITDTEALAQLAVTEAERPEARPLL